MKKFNPNKNIIIMLLLVIIAVTTLSVTVARRAVSDKPIFPQAVMNDTISFIDRTLSAPIRWIEKGASAVENLFITYEENEKLKLKLDTYDEMVQENKNKTREIATLKDELELQSTLTNFDKITSNVITRSPDTWQEIIVVDRGSQDGVEENMAVLANHGLIGRVIEVNNFSSKVELLTSSNQNSNQFPVRISGKKGETFGILKGYDQEKNVLIVEQLTGESTIEEGSVVQTSGLGGSSPADLPIGIALKESKDRFGLTRQIYVKPYAQMTDLSFVTIIKRGVGDE